MAVIQVERLFLVWDSIVLKQVEQFMSFTWLDFEYVAAKQWFTDIYSESDRATALISPLAQKAKEAKKLADANPEDEALQTALKELDDELTQCIRAQVTLNIMTLPVKAKGKGVSIAQYVQLENLHNLKFIKCDLFKSEK